MDIVGLDLHTRESQLSIKAEDGTITDRRIVTSRERFTAPMYANHSRRTKTDKRDARTLMDAGETGAWRPAYRLSEARRHVLAERDALVRARSRSIALAKALVRRDGLRVPTSASAWVPTRIAELELSSALTTEMEPLCAVFAPLNAQIAVADARIATFAKADPIVTRLTTAPGVGPVTASAFVATIDDITRFRTAHELEASLGEIPSERSSGEKRQLGRITKAGNGGMRWLLVEAAWQILRSKSPQAVALRTWTLTIAQRRGKRFAVVALARRLAGVMCAMCLTACRTMRNGSDPFHRPYTTARDNLGTTMRESSGRNRERRAREFP